MSALYPTKSDANFSFPSATMGCWKQSAQFQYAVSLNCTMSSSEFRKRVRETEITVQ